MSDKCEMTMGEDGNYFQCGKQAKFTIFDPLHNRRIAVCGTHAHAYNKKAIRYKDLEPARPIMPSAKEEG